jgi:hypothetical protein
LTDEEIGVVSKVSVALFLHSGSPHPLQQSLPLRVSAGEGLAGEGLVPPFFIFLRTFVVFLTSFGARFVKKHKM